MIKNLSRVGEIYSAAYDDGFLITVDPAGSSLTFVSGKFKTASFSQLAFVLGFSEPLKQAVATTNAMMGLRTWSERGMNMSWAYHPDNGLTFSIQLEETLPMPADFNNHCWQCLAKRADLNPGNCSRCKTRNIQWAKQLGETRMAQAIELQKVMAEAKANTKKTSPWSCLVLLLIVGGILFGVYQFLGRVVFHLF